jgi:hypothetical protein
MSSSDYDNLNPQIKKLLEETGTKITNAKDLEALSRVSVRDLAKLFDELAKNNKASVQKSKQEILSSWTKSMVEKHVVASPTVSSPTANLEVSLDDRNIILSDEELKKRNDELRKAELDQVKLEAEIRAANEAAARAAAFGDSKSLEAHKKKVTELKSKKRSLEEKSGAIRNASFYQTVFFKKSAKLQKLGKISKSSSPKTLTEENAPLKVDVVKHVLDNHIVFQLNCKNNKPDTAVQNLTAKLAGIPGLELDFTEDVSALKSDNPEAIFLAFKRKNPEELATGVAKGSIQYTETDVDPATGKSKGTPRSKALDLGEILLTAADYLLPGDETQNIEKDYAALQGKESKITVPFAPGDDIEDALRQLEEELGLDSFEKKLQDRGLERFTAVYNGAANKGGKRKPVLIKANLTKDKDGNVVAELSIRSDDPELHKDIAQSLQKILEKQRQKKVEEQKQREKQAQEELKKQANEKAEKEKAEKEKQAKEQAEKEKSEQGGKSDEEERQKRIQQAIDAKNKTKEKKKSALEKLSKNPDLKKLGEPHSVSDPVPLTETNDEYAVVCIKHTFPDCVVLQFDTMNNSKEEQKVDDSFIEIDASGAKGLTPKSVIKGNCDPKTGEGTSFVVYDKKKNEEPEGNLQNKLTFSMGEYNNGGKVDEMNDYQLEIDDLPLNEKDYILPNHDEKNFKDKWQKLGPNNESKRDYQAPGKTLQDNIDAIVEACPHLSPVGETWVPGDEHTLQLSGSLPNGDAVLVEFNLKEGDEQLTGVCRSPKEKTRNSVLDDLSDRLDEARQRRLKYEEDMLNPYFRDVFSLIPALKKLGAPSRSHEPVVVHDGSKLNVKLIKHFWKAHVLLHYICNNKSNNEEYEQVMVETEENPNEFIDREFFVQAGLLVLNQPEHTFMCYSYAEGKPTGTISPVLKYDVRKIDPKTGRPTGEELTESQQVLPDVSIKASDYPQ